MERAMVIHTQSEIDRLAEQRELARVRLEVAEGECGLRRREYQRISREYERAQHENNEPRKGGL